MKSIILILASLAASGCSTCANHPVACSVGGAIIAGSVAASLNSHSHKSRAPTSSNTQPIICNGGNCT